MDLGSNNNTLSLTGGDTTDDIGDSIIDLETRIATNETNITNLQTNLTTEASTRASADTTLQTNIDAEASTRASADTTLQNNIDAEETARIAGDNALTTYVDNSILNLIDGAGDAYDTLLELKNEIQQNDTSLNEVFSNVATKVSKSGDTMTGDLNIEGGNLKIYNDTANVCRITMEEALNNSNLVMEYNGVGSGDGNYFALYSGVPTWVGLGDGFNYVPSNGRVGIGLNNPSEKLEVNGNAIIGGDLTISNPNEIYYKGETLDARFHSLDTDYYTEAESDARFVNVAGDTMTNNLGFSGSNIGVNIYSSTGGNTHIGGQYNTTYLSNQLGTRIRSFNGSYSYIADFLTTGITLNKDTDITGGLDVGGDLNVDGKLTYDKARCGTTGEVFEDNIRNSTALATGTWHRIMTAGNNVGGTLIIALGQSGRHCYYEVKFSSCFWMESSLRVVNHHAFGTGSTMGVLKIRLQSANNGYLGTAFDIYTNNTIGANEITINLKNAYTDDDYTLVDFTPNPTDLNNGVDIKTLELDFNETLFGGVTADRYATTISDFRFSRAGLLTASSANITGNLGVGGTISVGTGNSISDDATYGMFFNTDINYIFRRMGVWKLRIQDAVSTFYTGLNVIGTATFFNTTSFEGALNTFTDDVAVGGEVSAGSADIIANLDVGGDLSVGGDVNTGGRYEVNNTPLITQVHSFYQNNANLLNLSGATKVGQWFQHSSIRDGAPDGVSGMMSPVRIKLHSIALSIESDTHTFDEDYTWTFQVRYYKYTTAIDRALLTTTNTNLAGQCVITCGSDRAGIDSSPTSVITIPANTSWGVYLSSWTTGSVIYGSEPSGQPEALVKAYFYQVA